MGDDGLSWCSELEHLLRESSMLLSALRPFAEAREKVRVREVPLRSIDWLRAEETMRKVRASRKSRGLPEPRE